MYRILIVDDIDLNRIIIRNALLNALPDADFVEAAHGRAALDILGDQDIDLVLLDLRMPVLDGFAVLETMKSDDHLCHIPVIIQSLVDDDDSIQRALGLGAYDYFVRAADSGAFRRELTIKCRNAVSAYGFLKAARQELDRRTQAEQRLALSRRRRQMTDLFEGLLARRLTYGRFSSQLRLLSCEPIYPLYCCLVAITSYKGIVKKDLQQHPAEWQNLEDSILTVLEQQNLGPVWPQADYITLLCNCPDPAATMAVWQERLHTALPGLTVVMAASDSCVSQHHLTACYRQGLDALTAARLLPGYDGRVFYANLGVERLLAPLAGRPDSEEYVTSILEPLLAHDRSHNTDYCRTLEAVLAAADLKEAAAAIGIHHKTVMFRRSRIQDILRVSLNDAYTRVALTTAILLYRLGGGKP